MKLNHIKRCCRYRWKWKTWHLYSDVYARQKRKKYPIIWRTVIAFLLLFGSEKKRETECSRSFKPKAKRCLSVDIELLFSIANDKENQYLRPRNQNKMINVVPSFSIIKCGSIRRNNPLFETVYEEVNNSIVVAYGADSCTNTHI